MTFRTIFIMMMLIIFYSCTQKSTAILKTSSASNSNQKAELLFFLNPNGVPCQMQDTILHSLEKEIESKVLIKRLSTQNINDRSYFYQYGIRALPLLVLIDANGKIIRRFSPGIKNKKIILSTVSDCQC